MKKEIPKRTRAFSTANFTCEQKIFTNTSFACLDLETRIGINIFNINPIMALSYFLCCFRNISNPNAIATFLTSCPFFSKKKIGEMLGNISNKFCEQILVEFINKFEIVGVPLEDSYRKFMSCFKMPGESQKIEKIIKLFSSQYFLSNKEMDFDGYRYENEDSVMVLLYALTMLNVDLHNCAINKKMTREEFIINVKRTEDCANVYEEILGQFYDNILNKEFETGFDNTSQLIQLRKLLCTNDLEFVTENRQLIAIFEGSEIYIDIFNRINLKPRTFFMFNDCFICLKKTSPVNSSQTINFQYKCKKIFKLAEYKVYPNHKSTLPNTLSFCPTTNKVKIQYKN
uniref:IQ motif and SEC7 domain-containing protein 3 (Trinotate prediction) n=1 Tax=Myxobolus squamalis TaxID=59785 RepID=A0A6B2G121_MYXSQ